MHAHLLEDFFGIRDFAAYVRLSFRSLKAFCEDHNSDPNSKNRITLSTYTVLPTMSMVVIDSQSKSAEMVVEYFTYHCGEERPLFIIKKKKRQKCLIAYILMRNNYFSHLRKWSNEFDIETAGRQF